VRPCGIGPKWSATYIVAGWVGSNLRTLIISDLHLGGHFFRGVLTRAEPLNRLLDALDGIDRLVLLGDTVELAERRPNRAMEAAGPVLREIGHRLGPDREVVIVPGNHDFKLARDWVRANGTTLTLDHHVPFDASPELARVVALLAPAQTTVRYPGVWLREGVFATHGHYLDVHLRPVSSYGYAPRAIRRGGPQDRATPAEYERARRKELARRPSASRRSPRSAGELVGLLRSTIAHQVKAHVLRPAVAPVTSTLLNAQMLRSGLPALAYAMQRLGVEADWVIFGHLHRLGPLAGEEAAIWAPGAGARIVNTGSWLWEPLVVNRAHPPHPYWPGGAVLLDDDGPPRAVGLLDDLTARELSP
jgi:UDP-2,3-diacylglucosamine pyrophosphatase LpxH